MSPADVQRRVESCKGALEEVLVDQRVTKKERDVLARLQGKLGLANATTEALERDVRAAMRPVSA